MEVIAKVKGITYQPFLGKELATFSEAQLNHALETATSFVYAFDDGKQLALSVWLTPKRTRSYPYARVYDTLSFGGRKATIIPIVKDEGKDGDCDYLQWDTVALMGLLGVYVIPAFYAEADRKPPYKNKITGHTLDVDYIQEQLQDLKHYHSSALHWNLEQFDRLPDIGQKALKAYERIHRRLGVQLPCLQSLPKKIESLKLGRDEFLQESRTRSRAAQLREIATIQPKEFFQGHKGSITITDLVGGTYHLTADHSEVVGGLLHLVESKHSNTKGLPSIDDIKDGLVKIALFSNLTEATVGTVQLEPQAVLRLSANDSFVALTAKQQSLLKILEIESRANGFDLDLRDLKGLV